MHGRDDADDADDDAAAGDNNIAPLPLHASFNSSQANHDLFCALRLLYEELRWANTVQGFRSVLFVPELTKDLRTVSLPTAKLTTLPHNSFRLFYSPVISVMGTNSA